MFFLNPVTSSLFSNVYAILTLHERIEYKPTYCIKGYLTWLDLIFLKKKKLSRTDECDETLMTETWSGWCSWGVGSESLLTS